MKFRFWNWFGIIVGMLGVVVAIVASINPMAIGQIFLQIGPQKMGNYIMIFSFILPLVIIIPILGPFAIKAIKNSQKKKRLLQIGQKASVEIVDIQDTGMTINRNPYVDITVKMPNGNKAVFQLLVSRVSIPRVGDKIEVIYDTSDQSVVMAA